MKIYIEQTVNSTARFASRIDEEKELVTNLSGTWNGLAVPLMGLTRKKKLKPLAAARTPNHAAERLLIDDRAVRDYEALQVGGNRHHGTMTKEVEFVFR